MIKSIGFLLGSKRIFAAVFVLLFLVQAAPTLAQSLSQSELLLGQKHSYSVFFRGNGEAVVYARLVLTNTTDSAMTDFRFEVPNAAATEVAIYQQKVPGRCLRYDYNNLTETREYECLQYGEPDYRYPSYYGYGDGATEYFKAKPEQVGNVFSFLLPEAISPSKSTALIIAYVTRDYVTEGMGVKKFKFETLKVQSRVQESEVSINVDSDLYLKGASSSVTYRDAGMTTGFSAAPASLQNKELDSLVSSIGAYGSIRKQTSGLAAGETFVVPGEYSSSRWRLYTGAILNTLLVIFVIFVALYFLTKMIKSRRTSSTGNSPLPAAPIAPHDTISILNMTNAAIGFGSAASVVVLTIALQYLSRMRVFGYFFDDFMAIIIVLAIGLLYLILLFLPAILVGIKSGWKSAVSVIIAEFLWLVVLIILYSVLYQLGVTVNYPTPYADYPVGF